MIRNDSKNKSVIGIVIATACILVYLGALVSVIVRVHTNMEERRELATLEFNRLVDVASSAGVSTSFMDEDFIRIIQNEFRRSVTLEGVIIWVDQNWRFGFEKEQGRAINWVGDSPRGFRNRFDFLRQGEFFQPVRIQGLRSVNIEARAGAFDRTVLSGILWQAMLLVAIALAVAFTALMVESKRRAERPKMAEEPRAAQPSPEPVSEGRQERDEQKQPAQMKAGYSDRGRVVWIENTEIRLAEELRKCAAEGQDLAFIVMEFKPTAAADESFYARFAADAVRFFASRDFVCEKGERGISIICSGLNLDAGFLNANEFHSRIMGKYPSLFKLKTDLCVGISARSGRPVNAERVMFEAEEALERAMMDPVSHIVAFKSDPEKYRAFMESRGL